MAIYKPTELLQFLQSLGVSPKKGLSQNFLIDGNIIKKIADTAQVQPGDVVLEIGPGPGALTEILLEKGAHVIAVEKDKVLAQALERLQTADHRLHVYCDDIMEFDIEGVIRKFTQDKAKVIANLPYHITTPILAYLVQRNTLFSNIVVMVQEEVARRFVGLPGTRDYSSFTVYLQFFSNPKFAFTVSRHCFFPPPKIESAVVMLEPKTPPIVSNQEAFFKLTRTAFGHRRKMLRASLKELYAPDAVMQALESMQINPLIRPESLSLNDWLTLFKLLGGS